MLSWNQMQILHRIYKKKGMRKNEWLNERENLCTHFLCMYRYFPEKFKRCRMWK